MKEGLASAGSFFIKKSPKKCKKVLTNHLEGDIMYIETRKGTPNKEEKDMTFKQAYKIGMEKSEDFRSHNADVLAKMKNGEQSSCLIFSVGQAETFYYGFDGVQLHKGRHTSKRSEYLLNHGLVLVIK